MRTRVTFTGKYHCPTCWIEEELEDEDSLVCEECGQMLVRGPLSAAEAGRRPNLPVIDLPRCT